MLKKKAVSRNIHILVKFSYLSKRTFFFHENLLAVVSQQELSNRHIEIQILDLRESVTGRSWVARKKKLFFFNFITSNKRSSPAIVKSKILSYLVLSEQSSYFAPEINSRNSGIGSNLNSSYFGINSISSRSFGIERNSGKRFRSGINSQNM